MRGGARRLQVRRSSHSALASWLRPSARTATYVEPAAEGANEADGPFSAACLLGEDLAVGESGALAGAREAGIVVAGHGLERVRLDEVVEGRLGFEFVDHHVLPGLGARMVGLERDGRIAAHAEAAGHARRLRRALGVVPLVEGGLPLLRDGRLDHEDGRTGHPPPLPGRQVRPERLRAPRGDLSSQLERPVALPSELRAPGPEAPRDEVERVLVGEADGPVTLMGDARAEARGLADANLGYGALVCRLLLEKKKRD